MITLTSVSGRFVQMINCRRAPVGYDQRLEALCSKEVLYVEKPPAARGDDRRCGWLSHRATDDYFIERFAEAYRDEMRAFVELIETGRKPLAGIRDGLEAQRLAEAALVSMRTGQAIGIGPDGRP